MKQCDRGLSPLAPPFAIASSSLSSFAASESDPEDSFWRDFTFDFSFLTSDEQKNGTDDGDDVDSLPKLSRRPDSNTVPQAEESELYGLAANARTVRNLEIRKRVDSSQPSSSLAAVSTNHFDSNVANDGAEGRLGKEACSGKFLVSKDISESNISPLFSKMLKCSLPSDQDDVEVDSPCWRGTRSSSFRRCTDDVNVLYGLNPLAPQFIPSSAKMKLDKNETEFEENGSSSLKRSLSSTFPPSSGEFGFTDSSGAGIEQDYSQRNNRTEFVIHDADESLGLVSQDSVSEAMSMLDISYQFQTPKKLDPLAPVFVPANAKLSAVVHADHMIAIERNADSTYALSSSDDMLLENLKVETHSSEVSHSLRNLYSSNVHESGATYSFNTPGSQVQISDNAKLDSSSNKSRGQKKLNPLARQFSLADTKQKVYGGEENQAVNGLPPMVNSSVLLSPIGYRNHKESSFNEVDTKQMGRLHPNILRGSSSKPTKEPFHILETSSSSNHVKASSDFGDRHGCSTSSPSSEMDVKKILTTIHGLSELLTHVHGSETSDPPNEQDLDLINCTVQNLNSYINNRVQEHTGNYASAVDTSCDFNPLHNNMRKLSIRDHQLQRAQNMALNADVQRKEYSMVSGNMEPMVPVSHFEFGATQENGFAKVTGNYQTEEQINPRALFYRSLWLKAKADRLARRNLKEQPQN
ncbi:unnamed protein product [Microthlaspi erraticum]|uniref:Uncharacterized protein n=1 Tax=Microthlaspi erraticum TaxID=1685480 RepID=A0A6D2J2B3_9BRAS|nr:unnamed protein product [Microthlaspi erraticum]